MVGWFGIARTFNTGRSDTPLGQKVGDGSAHHPGVDDHGFGGGAMPKGWDWNDTLYLGSAPHDAQGRLPYAPALADRLAAALALDGTGRPIDVGCGLAALDRRVKVCIGICCFSDYEAVIARSSLEAHGLYYFVPGLLKHFTSAQINALIAPRAHLSLAGINDPLTPPEGLDRIDAELKEVYATAGAPDAWRLSRHATGHMETAAMRKEVVGFLQEWMRPVMSESQRQ